ncbi:hypothetical protein DAEQUDRAFT_694424 [Daedalea quercina L-15889]|uniref:Mus7/MMS22 family-domain-containing protein n=1 Tax=Daedalea quercina L-15889 TaxID=1314783 RepID=A0A165NRZ1_9APHY|nr:hypothetical protein DAEQUDRAFT_694424 [Daedalea quercina L-15889]
MEDDEVIPTSDAEELEELQAGSPSYWVGHEDSYTLRDEVHPQAGTQRLLGHVHEHTDYIAGLSSPPQTERVPGSPWKRRKLSHPLELLSEYGTPPRTGIRSSTNANATPLRSQRLSTSSPTTSGFPRARSARSSSSVSSTLLPTPTIDSDDEDPLVAAGYDISQVCMQNQVDTIAAVSVAPVRPSSLVAHQFPQNQSLPFLDISSPTTRSPSVDPLSLFSPRLRAPSDRSTESRTSPSPSPIASPRSSRHSSPLTPVQSPTRQHESVRRDHSPYDSVATAKPSTSGPPTEDMTPEQLEAIAAEQAQGRYSLRTRQARQKNPYAYDKAMYKRQMRSNPDAIVKVVSPRRRGKHRSRSVVRSGSDDEYGGQEEEEPDVDDELPIRRRRSRSRSRGDGAARASNSEAGDEEITSRPRSRHKTASKQVVASPSQQTSRASNAKDPPQRPVWQPSAFDETFSSSDENMSEEVPVIEKDKPPDKARRKRARPFPMKKKDIVCQSSTPEYGAAETISDGHEGAADKNDAGDSSAGHVDEPAPTWRRRKNSASLPLQTPPSSPLVDNASFHDMEEQPWAVDHDSFHNSGSPLPPPPSSTPVNIDLSPPGMMSPQTTQQVVASDSDVEIVSQGRQSPPGLSGDDADGSGLEHDQTVDNTYAKDRKRFKALRRMMPIVLIQRYMQDAQKPKLRRTATPSDDSSSESRDEDQPLRPGQSKIIRRTASERANIEIRGDSESSDVEIVDEETQASSSASSSESDMDKVTVQKRRHDKRVTEPLTQQSASVVEDDTDSDLDQEIGQWIPERPSRGSKSSGSGAVREKDIIDYMLSRTRPSGGGKYKKGSARQGRSRGGAKTSSNTLHVAVSGARPGYQTTLPYDRASTSRSDSSLLEDPNEHHVQIQIRDGVPKTRTVRERKEPRNQGTLFMFAGKGGHLVSGRTHKAPVTIDAEQPTTNPASILRPANRDYSSSTVCKPKSRGAKPKTAKERTLRDFWDDNPDVVELHPRASVEVDSNHGIPSRRVTLDFDVPFLPAGMSFGADCYLGRGCLSELVGLITARHEAHCPAAHTYLNFELRPTMSAQEFELVMEKTCQHLRGIFSQRDLPSTGESRPWLSFLHSASQHLSWLLSRITTGEYVALCTFLQRQLAQLQNTIDEPMEVLPEDDQPSALELEIRWFMLEASTRLECQRAQKYGDVEESVIKMQIKRLLTRLWSIGFQDLLVPFLEDAADLPHAADILFVRRAAELWVSLVHYVDVWTSTKDPKLDESRRLGSLWHILRELVVDEGLLRDAASEVVSSEMLWHCIFTLCALSQFSVHGTSLSSPRIPVSWDFVALALDRIKLKTDPTLESSLSKRSLHKRDEYIRILVSRCFILSRKWKWTLDDAATLFNRLLDIFKSRHFANLADEFPELPSFLRHSNIKLLSEKKRSDTAFTLLLKLVVKAADDTCPLADENRGVVGVSQKVKKLLSLCVPVGSVPFTKARPPNRGQLSMLYNRFSAIAVAIFLEPSPGGVKSRLANARRYVTFKDADDETRRACIRGVMHLAILVRHLQLPLEDIWDWLAHISNTLVDEYVQTRGDRRVAVGIQMLLGCVRRVIETPSMDPGQGVSEYPDPAWLSGPWVKRIFSLDTQLTANRITGMEIRKLVQSFLNVRAAALPPPRWTRPSIETAEDSQESQEYFGAEDMNWDDPELVAALDPENAAKAQQLKRKDETVCEIIAQDIAETIYRLVMRHFSGPNESGTLDQYSDETDKWVDCWVGCASVLVQNGKRDWSWYLTLGPQSWEKISDDSWRRRVGLRFMLMVLRLDPAAYFAYQFQFLDVLMQALVAVKVTIEHEYMSLLCSIDGLRHPLLDGMPLSLDPETADYMITRKDFLNKRLLFAHKVIANLAHHLLSNADQEPKTVVLREKCVGSILTLLSTMQNIQQSFPADSEERAKYTSFCQQVHGYLSPFPILRTNPRLAPLVEWIGTL